MNVRLACLLLGAAISSSCLRLGYGVTRLEEPVDRAVLSSLRPATDDLASCLLRLGAPHYVWEYRGDGVAIAWYYLDGSDFDIDLSYALSRELTSASFSIDLDDNDLPGAVLWFDRDLVLIEWREGNMRDLTNNLRRRSAPVDDAR